MSQPAMASSTNDESLKLAVAISLLRSKIGQKRPPTPTLGVLRWKEKVRKLEQEIVRLKEELKEAEDASRFDIYPQTTLCKCYFFDNIGILAEDSSVNRFDNVLRRRFLRLVRLKGKSETAASIGRGRFSDNNCEDETEQLKASVDFLINISDRSVPVDVTKFKNWSHQAVDFIIESSVSLLSKGNSKSVEGIISCLITRLVWRMCSPFKNDDSQFQNSDFPFLIQHMLRKLGCQPYIGQLAILSVSQKISEVAESLLFSDPFSDAFPVMHESMFVLIQLIEFLISDNLLSWATIAEFDKSVCEEWVSSLLRAQEAVQVLESRSGLYAVYMDRVTGELAKSVGQSSSLQGLNSHILNHLFRS